MDNEPLAITIRTATELSGLSRSEIYRRLGAGDLRAVKAGTRTLIPMDSLTRLLADLPAATFRSRKTD
jgi:excisionase family DNA binding protein